MWVPGSCPRHFLLTMPILLPYLLFLMVGSEIAGPDLVSFLFPGASTLWASEQHAVSLLNVRKSFFGRRQEAWDCRLLPAGFLLVALLVKFPVPEPSPRCSG